MANTNFYPANGLEINFRGLPMVVNDGQTENTLRIALTNNNFTGLKSGDQDSAITFTPATPIYIWFVVDDQQASAEAQRSWALTSYDAFHDGKVQLAPDIGHWDVERSDDLTGNPLNDSLQGWKLTPIEALSLAPGQSLVLTLSGLTTALPDGYTSCYCQVELPVLDAYGNEAESLLKVIGPITKSRLIIAGDKVGIGTASPLAALEVNGAVRASGDVKTGGGLEVWGVLTTKDNAAIGGDLQADGSLTTTGAAAIGGDIQSQGRIEDKFGAVMPVGAIIAYGGSTKPESGGWLLCDGQTEVTPANYPDLYEVLRGNVTDPPPLYTPDLRSRFIVGMGIGTITDEDGHPLTTYPLNSQGGAESQALTIDQMPAHRHGYRFVHSKEDNEGWVGELEKRQEWRIKMTDRGTGAIDPYSSGEESDMRAQAILEAGKGQAHENRPPFYALTYIIKC